MRDPWICEFLSPRGMWSRPLAGFVPAPHSDSLRPWRGIVQRRAGVSMVLKYHAPRAARHFAFSFFRCALTRFSRNFRALFARFRKTDSDCLFSRRHFPALSTLAGPQSSSLFSMHGAFHALARSLAIFPARSSFCRHFIPPVC